MPVCRETDCCNEPTNYHSDQEGFDEAQNCLVVQILTTELPSSDPDAAYSATLNASGGTTPYIWTVTNGALPDGLTLSTSGVISGTPTEDGTFDFTVTVTDAGGNQCETDLSISIFNALKVDAGAYWPFDLPDQLVDVTGNGNDFVLSAGSVSDDVGIINEAGSLAFGTIMATGDSATLPFDVSDGFTFAGWFKRTSTASIAANIIFQLDQGLTRFQFVNNQETIFDPEPERFRWFQIAGTGFTTPNSEFHNITPSHAVWLFLACWLDPSDNKMRYRINDTVFVTSGVATPEASATAKVTIQVSADLLLDECGYWPRKLTTEELDFLRTGVTWPFV